MSTEAEPVPAGTGDAPNTSVVTVDGEKFRVIQEGLAKILAPHAEASQAKKTRAGGDEQDVFYNPIQQFNRDLSVLAMKVLAEEIVAVRNAKRNRETGRPKFKYEHRAKRKRGDEPPSSIEAALEVKKLKTGDEAHNTAVPNGDAAVIDESLASDATAKQLESDNIVEEKTSDPKVTTPTPSQFRILDALSATGLRALRYAKEVPEATLITANDLSPEAVKSIKRNLDYNQTGDKVHAIQGNATGYMYHIGNQQTPKMPDGSKGKYDAIDLDPYGTAAPFLDAALSALNDGGVLCVTCTDSAIFASVGYPEKTFAYYGGIPWKGTSCHEAGLRLIIQSVAVSAARRGIAIEPLLSLSIDYYVRIFIRVRHSREESKLLPGKTMTVFNCDQGCHSWSKQFALRTTVRNNKHGKAHYHFSTSQGPSTSPTCEHCGFKTHIAGPMWGGPLHNPFFIQRLLDKLPLLDREVYGTVPRLEGMLYTALHETLLPPGAKPVGQPKTSTSQEQVLVRSESEGNDELDNKISTDVPFRPMERLDPSIPDHHPFFFTASELSRILHCTVPPDAAVRGALIGLGYRVTRSHTKGGSIRTDAPWSVIWDVMRAWVNHKTPARKGVANEGTAAQGLWKKERAEDVRTIEQNLTNLFKDRKQVKVVMDMIEELRRKEGQAVKTDISGTGTETETETDKGTDANGSTHEDGKIFDKTVSANGGRKTIVFDEILGRDPDKDKYVRYQQNPKENWGPQLRAG